MKNLKVLMGENLVWESPVRVGSHHYARLFLQNGNKIFWVSLPWSPFHILKGFKHERIRQWNRGRVKDNGNGLKTFCPFSFLPYRNNFFFRNEFAAWNTLRYSFPNFRKILESVDYSEVDVLWLTDPRFISLKDYVKYKYLIHRCVDDVSTFSNISPTILKLEKEIVQEADIVFATARTLVEKLEKWRKDVIFLPNAVDLGNFLREEYSEPGEIKDIPHPRVVYVGTLGPWFDVDLVAFTARKLQDSHFVLIGPQHTNCDILKGIENIHLLGPKNFERIPNFLKFSDVAIIPFRKSKLTDAVNPVKLYEYLSLGLPVVTTNFQEVIDIDSPALISSDYDEFVSMVFEVSLSDAKSSEKYVKFAKENSWQKRFNAITNAFKAI